MNPTEPALKPKQLQAIALLASGLSITDVAKAINAGRATIKRWLRDPYFRSELDNVVSQNFNALTALVLNNSSEAFEILLDLARDEKNPAYSRVSAATNVLEFASKSFATNVLERRLTALETDREDEPDGD